MNCLLNTPSAPEKKCIYATENKYVSDAVYRTISEITLRVAPLIPFLSLCVVRAAVVCRSRFTDGSYEISFSRGNDSSLTREKRQNDYYVTRRCDELHVTRVPIGNRFSQLHRNDETQRVKTFLLILLRSCPARTLTVFIADCLYARPSLYRHFCLYKLNSGRQYRYSFFELFTQHCFG
jgi:hypothetical protein